MKKSRKLLTLAAATFAFSAIMTPQRVLALTAPCTAIINQASLDYEVGGVDQTAVLSDDGTAGATPTATTFNVGVKIDLAVDGKDGGANVPVAPGSTPSLLTFTVTNKGNSIQDYDLSHILAADGTVSNTAAMDNFSLLLAGGDALLPEDSNASTVKIYLEKTGTAVGFGTDDEDITLSHIIEDLDPTTTYPNETSAGTRTVYIVYTPSGLTAAMDQVSVSYLKATTLWANGAALAANLTDGDYTNDSFPVTNDMAPNGSCAGGGTTVDVVVGDIDSDESETVTTNDGLRDGAYLDKSAFIVETAKISVKKEMTPYSDPVNGTTNPRAIPGAIVTYTLTVTNEGNADATNVTVTDADLAAEIGSNYVAFSSVFVDGSNACAALPDPQGVVVGGFCKTNKATDDSATWDSGTNTLTVTGLTVPKKVGAVNGEVVIKFQMEIK